MFVCTTEGSDGIELYYASGNRDAEGSGKMVLCKLPCYQPG
jgi:hypothetical protein